MADTDQTDARTRAAAEQALFFTLTWFVTARMMPSEDARMMLDVLREVLPQIDASRRDLQPLARAGDIILDLAANGETQGMSWARAMLDTSLAVEQFAKMRVGRALDHMRPQEDGA